MEGIKIMKHTTSELLEKYFDTAFDAPNGIARLRELILTLAMQGKLVPQDPSDEPASVAGKSARDAEVIRMPGYFKPFHFITMFEYVRGRHFAEQGFQRFLHARFDELKAKGLDPEVW